MFKLIDLFAHKSHESDPASAPGGEAPPAAVVIDGAPAFPIGRHIGLQEGYPILDWKAVQAWVDPLGSDDLQGQAWLAAERAWLLHMRASLGPAFELRESSNAMLLSSLELNIARSTLDYMELANVTDALGHKSELNYNAAGDLTALIDPLGNDTRLAYDAVGRPVTSTDPLGYSRALLYNALSQPTQSTDPLGGTTTNSYDTAQRLTAVTNARGKPVERYGWDAGDRLISRTDALNRAETMTYDAQGRIATLTDRKGQTSRYRYDAEGRVVRIERADGDVNLSYDAVGRLSRTDDAASSVSYEYDNADRIVKETQSSAAGSHIVQYEYDPLDRRTKRTVDGTEVTTYAWDRAGRLTSIGHAGQTTSYEYDAADRLTRKTLPNGIVQTMSYDDASRLTSIEYTQPGGTAIETIAYTYDANGQRTSKASSGNSSAQESAFTATYDDADRMTGVVLKGLGNAGADLSCTLAYDDNGNLSTKTCGAATTSYSWDSRNRLAAISGPGVNASFAYDVRGRRVSRTVNGETTTYVYDGMQAIGQTKGGVATSLLTGLQIDEVIATYATTGNRTLLTDALGSVIAEAKDDRSVVTRREYTPFGQGAVSGEASANDSQYTGRENDGTGLYFYRARYYDAQVKRFVQSDPIGLAGGINTYAYVNGQPTRYADPLGLWSTGSHDFFIDQLPVPLTPEQRQWIKNGSAYTDSSKFQDPAHSYMHAMSSKALSGPEARKKWCQFMREKYDSYNRNNSSSNPRMREVAYFNLGMMLHGVMDSTSPAHAGFQRWSWNPGTVDQHGDMPGSIENSTYARRYANETVTMMVYAMSGQLPGDCGCE